MAEVGWTTRGTRAIRSHGPAFTRARYCWPFLASARDRQQHALARSGVDSIVGFGDAVQRQGIVAWDRECSLACCGGEIDSSLAFCCRWEVVAAEESDSEVGEAHGPEREVGPVAAGGVGGDEPPG